MTYSNVIERRFGDGGPSGEGIPDNDFIRRVISRKTVRRYSDVVPDENLLDLLVAAALSASAKSDFQQASILRVVDPAKRTAIGTSFPEHAVDRAVAGVLSSSSAMRGGCSASASCAASRFATARLKVSSTPASTRPWRCRR